MKLSKFLLMFLLLNPYVIRAQSTESAFPQGYYDTLALLFLLLIVIIFIAFIYFGTGEGKPAPAVKHKKLLEIPFINKFITGTVPLEKEKEILLADDYDGIKELDNRVPPWFNYLFYGSILFAIYYLLDYHVFETSQLQEAEYAEEMQAAQMQREQLAKSGAFITEETVVFTNNSEALEKGKQVYNSNCVACHASDGGGLVGPNLTDDYWIHGGDIQNVFKTIKYGVPAKGMIAWQQQLNPVQIQEVSSYILSLKGSKPLNPKQPEGQLFQKQDTLKTLSVK